MNRSCIFMNVHEQTMKVHDFMNKFSLGLLERSDLLENGGGEEKTWEDIFRREDIKFRGIIIKFFFVRKRSQSEDKGYSG